MLLYMVLLDLLLLLAGAPPPGGPTHLIHTSGHFTAELLPLLHSVVFMDHCEHIVLYTRTSSRDQWYYIGRYLVKYFSHLKGTHGVHVRSNYWYPVVFTFGIPERELSV